jgi:hypothetical protein
LQLETHVAEALAEQLLVALAKLDEQRDAELNGLSGQRLANESGRVV